MVMLIDVLRSSYTQSMRRCFNENGTFLLLIAENVTNWIKCVQIFFNNQ